MQNTDFLTVPTSFMPCFNGQCTLKETCMRYFVGNSLADDTMMGWSVFPNAFRDGSCKYYVEKRIIRAAWGFRKLFLNVKHVDDSPLRNEIKYYLGGHGTYYRYMNGEQTLTPEQQEWILNLFRQHGYTEDLAFDHYVDRYALE